MSGAPPAAQTTVRVWDPLVRIGHWSLVASIAAAWFTREGNEVWHERIGYTALAIVAVRIVWGFAGSRYAAICKVHFTPARNRVERHGQFIGSASACARA